MRFAIPILIIVWLSVLLASCHTARSTHVSTTIQSDSLITHHLREIAKESISKEEKRDSVAIEKVVSVKDSVVLVVDTTGKIIKVEHYRSTDTNTNRERASNQIKETNNNNEMKDTTMTNQSTSLIASKEDTIIIEKSPSLWERIKDKIAGILAVGFILIAIGLWLHFVRRDK